MIRYYVYNFEHGQDFSIDKVSFQQVNDYKDRIEAWEKEEKENIKEKTDQFTFYAIISDEKQQPSMLYPEVDKTTPMDDMMILLSLAQSRNVFYAKAEDTISKNKWTMPLGGNRKAWGFKVISEHEIGNFLNTSLNQIREKGWVEKTGFNPSVFWWLESTYFYRPVETKFISGFIALEILANIHANSKRIKNSGVRTRIEALVNSYDWNFIDSTLIKDWVEIRNEFMHEGSTKKFQSKKSKDERNIRYSQLVYYVQIALIDLLGFKNFIKRQDIIDQMKTRLARAAITKEQV